MAVSMRLEVRQAQSLAMTPQLLQSIRILQYDHLELRDFLRREGERNPLLRIVDRAPRGAAARRPASGSPGPRLEPAPPARPSLPAHALAEIADALRAPADRRVAEALLVDLDEAGYLRVDPAEAGPRLGAPAEEIERILAALRAQAEPAGLFAADLAQCLALQLLRRGRLDPVMEAVLARLDLVARRDVAALSRLTGEDGEGIAAIIAELRGLDPKPGRLFETADAGAVEPDLLLEPVSGGGWRLSVNPRTVPKVLVDEDYARSIGPASESDRAFLADCRTSAGWLARALDQRARSVLKVAAEILRRQERFLSDGAPALRPMTLAAVAEAVGLHESTVSRAVANKCVATPRGTFELKTLFTASLPASGGGEAHSASSVRERIRRLVAAERPGAILSDEEIAARLKDEGIEVARRTVAKYREALGIASSAQRRREMRLVRVAS